MFNPLTYAYSNVTAASGFGGGVLLPSGNVMFVPNTTANIGQLNPTSLVFSNVTATGVIGAIGGVLLPNGNVVFATQSSSRSNAGMYNPTLNPPTYSNISIGQGSFGGVGGVLVPNGNVIFFPAIFSFPLSFNPTTFASKTLTGTGGYNIGLGGGVLLPSGNVVYCGGSMIDPVALTQSPLSFPSSVTNAFNGATLIPSGQVVFTPYASANVGLLDTMTPAPPEMCLSPYFNKF
jgi:hypothetical protein